MDTLRRGHSRSRCLSVWYAPDPANPPFTLPLEPWGGVSLNLEFLFRPRERATIDLWGSFKNTRPSGAARTQLSNSWGGGITLGLLVWQFLSGDTLAASSEYLADGFIPGMAIGASGQYLHCDGGVYCDSGKINDVSVTPFIDVPHQGSAPIPFLASDRAIHGVSTASGPPSHRHSHSPALSDLFKPKSALAVLRRFHNAIVWARMSSTAGGA